MEFIIFLVILIISTFLLYKKRKKSYPYAVNQDEKHAFKNGQKLHLKHNSLSLPSNVQEHTLFLKIKIKSSFLGFLKQPYIEISAKGKSLKQYIEHGAKGDRYLNISNFNLAKEITLKPKRMQICSDEVELFQFKNPELKDKKILIVAPHPDDAEIAAYGLYSQFAKDVFVLTYLAGEKGSFKYRELYDNVNEHQQKKGEIRTWNALTVPLMAGVSTENVVMLGYFDNALLKMFNDKKKNFGSDKLNTDDVEIFRKFNFSSLGKKLTGEANWNDMIQNLKMILTEFQPDVIITPHPFIDSHEDHQYATISIIQALKELNLHDGKLLLYTNHYTEKEFYPLGKIGAIMPLPFKSEANIYCSSVFSFPVSEKEQKDKILAFDAMNDLRPNTEYRFAHRLFADGFTRGREKLLSIEKDYFNRYIRSNELFFVVDFDEMYQPEKYKALIEGLS
ncbi:PIG-L deacetylase family protein [Ornithobacterium rhinotracheale]|uniref:PIG-L deacetylase family protein n=1 Tax=Ornithobacterium rhinotracheale TaxID=28251 RepID=UPI003872E170